MSRTVQDPAPSTAPSPTEERLSKLFRLVGFGGIVDREHEETKGYFSLRFEDGTQVLVARFAPGNQAETWTFEQPFLRGTTPAVIVGVLGVSVNPANATLTEVNHKHAIWKKWSSAGGTVAWVGDASLSTFAVAIGVYK